MSVADLIELLSQMDPDAPVVLCGLYSRKPEECGEVWRAVMKRDLQAGDYDWVECAVSDECADNVVCIG